MTENFQLWMALQSDTADELEILNLFNEKQEDNIRFVANGLEQFHWLVGEITSWFRSKELNKKVGGVDDSYHTKGLAVDFRPASDYQPADVARILYDLQLPFLRKVIIYDNKAHVHVSFQRLSSPETKVGAPQFYRTSLDGKYLPLYK